MPEVEDYNGQISIALVKESLTLTGSTNLISYKLLGQCTLLKIMSSKMSLVTAKLVQLFQN